jgi:hypothetical protein
VIELTTRTSGPIFDGRAQRAVTAYTDAAERRIADVGVAMVRAELDVVLQNPTGFYESQIQADRLAGDSIVTDGGVIYGPWLEGTSERNRTTRFRGYLTFRRTRDRLQRAAGAIGQRALRPFLRRMQ